MIQITRGASMAGAGEILESLVEAEEGKGSDSDYGYVSKCNATCQTQHPSEFIAPAAGQGGLPAIRLGIERGRFPFDQIRQ